MNNTYKNSQCPQAEDLLSVLMDNEGSPAELDLMQKHVPGCSTCSSLLEEFKITKDLMMTRGPEPVRLSPVFTARVMDEVSGYEETGILEDIIGLSRKLVTSIAMIVLILLGVIYFPRAIDVDTLMIDELTITNGVESEVLEKDEITHDDVVSLLFTMR